MKSTFIRSPKGEKNPYVMIRKEPLEDKKISWKAKGILSYLLSLPDDWQIYETELVKHSSDGRDSLRSGIKELIEFGYIERVRNQASNGRFAGYTYTVYEIPHHVGKTNNGKSKNGKPNTTNNNTTNNNINKKNSASDNAQQISKDNITEETFERLWKLYPIKKGKGQVSKTKKKEIEAVGEDQFKRCIERYKRSVEKERQQGFKDLRYMNGSTFFNSGYVDYLDESVEVVEKKTPPKIQYVDGGYV